MHGCENATFLEDGGNTLLLSTWELPIETSGGILCVVTISWVCACHIWNYRFHYWLLCISFRFKLVRIEHWCELWYGHHTNACRLICKLFSACNAIIYSMATVNVSLDIFAYNSFQYKLVCVSACARCNTSLKADAFLVARGALVSMFRISVPLIYTQMHWYILWK